MLMVEIGLVCCLEFLDCYSLPGKEIDTIDLYLNGIDWLMYICIHRCFCVSDLSDKRLNRTHKSPRRLLDYMGIILWDLFVLLLIRYREITSAYSSYVLHQVCSQYCFYCLDSVQHVDKKIMTTKINMEWVQVVEPINKATAACNQVYYVHEQ